MVRPMMHYQNKRKISIDKGNLNDLDKYSAKYIIQAMRHIAPHVVYSEATLSFMAEGSATSFYEGEGEYMNDENEDPSVIFYHVVQVQEDDKTYSPRDIITESIN